MNLIHQHINIVINSVINNHKEKPIIPNYFETENIDIHNNNNKIANTFNDFL